MNILDATLTAITSSEHLSLLNASVGEETFMLLLAEQCQETIGAPLKLTFKETEIILSKDPLSTTANCARAMVKTITQGVILSEITLDYREQTLRALVPTLTFERLGVHEGDLIYWVVQPSEISLLREKHGS